MDKGFVQQLCVFAAIFLAIQIGFDMMQGLPITPAVFLSRVITTAMATAIYGAFSLWLKKRKDRKD